MLDIDNWVWVGLYTQLFLGEMTMKSLLIKTVFGFTLLSISALPAAYADLKNDVQVLCDKFQTCMLEHMASQSIPIDAQQLVTSGVFHEQCSLQLKKYGTSVKEAGLSNQAQSCVGSLLELSCAEIMSPSEGAKTKQCEYFEKSAREAGVDVTE